MRNFMTNAAVAFASVALTTGIVAFADPANASTGVEGNRVIVKVADLNLRTDAGRATAERRIHSAVDTVCGDGDNRDLQAAQCRSQANDDAKQALGHLASL